MYSLHAALDRLPAGDDADRHQAGGQDHERQRDAVDAHVVADRAGEPRRAARRTGIRPMPGSNRHHSISEMREGDERRPQRDPAGVARDGGVLAAACSDDEQRADERQEGGEGEDRPARPSVASRREHEPGDERRNADQHREGVVVDVAGLQPHHVAGDVEHAGRDAVGTEAVDDRAVAALPEQPPSQSAGRTKMTS